MRSPYDIELIDRNYLDSLIGEPEGYVLEFKRAFDLKHDQHKVEIAADVTSFANEAGGDIYIGVDEDSGVASAVVGIPAEAADTLDRQLAQSLHSKTEPRVPFRTHQVRIGDGKVVLVVRVPRSAAAPHAVRINENLRFFGRNRTAKYPLNVAQIRERFLAAGNLEERLRSFVLSRWAREDDYANGMFEGVEAARFFLHIVPYGTLLGESSVDTEEVQARMDLASAFFPDFGHYAEKRMTADGLQFSRGRRETTWSTTSQLFSDGRIERLSRDIGYMKGAIKLLADKMIVEELGEFTSRALLGLTALGIEPPYFVIGSLIHVRDFHLDSTQGPFRDTDYPIDRDKVVLPTCRLDHAPVSSQEALEALRPLVGGLLHAFGQTTAGWYKDGTFVKRL